MTPFDPHDFDDGIIKTLVPPLDIAFHQDHFDFRVRRDQILGKSKGGHVNYDAVLCEELIPLFAGERFTFAGELYLKSRDPHCTIMHVIIKREEVTAGDPEKIESDLHN